MEPKIDLVKKAAAAGDWKKAISVASKFQRLSAHRAAILDAQTAITNPGFMRQIGRDPDACVAAGILALTVAYRLK